MKPVLWIGAGHAFVCLGVVGIFIPLLPTTPFLLAASWCYSKGSVRFQSWLLNHPRLGPYVLNWQRYGAIPLRAKIAAVGLIALNFLVISLFVDVSVPLKAVLGLLLLAAAVFIVSRPGGPSGQT